MRGLEVANRFWYVRPDRHSSTGADYAFDFDDLSSTSTLH